MPFSNEYRPVIVGYYFGVPEQAVIALPDWI